MASQHEEEFMKCTAAFVTSLATAVVAGLSLWAVHRKRQLAEAAAAEAVQRASVVEVSAVASTASPTLKRKTGSAKDGVVVDV